MMPMTNADKKRAQRAREKAELDKHGGQRVTVLMYGDTLNLLDRECLKFGFTGKQRYAETLTHILHIRDDRNEPT